MDQVTKLNKLLKKVYIHDTAERLFLDYLTEIDLKVWKDLEAKPDKFHIVLHKSTYIFLNQKPLILKFCFSAIDLKVLKDLEARLDKFDTVLHKYAYMILVNKDEEVVRDAVTVASDGDKLPISVDKGKTTGGTTFRTCRNRQNRFEVTWNFEISEAFTRLT